MESRSIFNISFVRHLHRGFLRFRRLSTFQMGATGSAKSTNWTSPSTRFRGTTGVLVGVSDSINSPPQRQDIVFERSLAKAARPLPPLKLETSCEGAATAWISVAGRPRLGGFKDEQNRFSKGMTQNNIAPAYIYMCLRQWRLKVRGKSMKDGRVLKRRKNMSKWR